MKLDIKEIYSKEMFTGLMLGKPKDRMYEKELQEIKEYLTIEEDPIFNFSETKWYRSATSNTGTWGHLTAVRCEIAEEDERYSFYIIFNYLPLGDMRSIITDLVSKIDYRNDAFKWNIADW